MDVLLLDKTGTITLGNRMAADFVPAAGVRVEDLAEAAQLASLADETPEDGRSRSSRRSASPSGVGTSRARRASSPSPRRPG